MIGDDQRGILGGYIMDQHFAVRQVYEKYLAFMELEKTYTIKFNSLSRKMRG